MTRAAIDPQKAYRHLKNKVQWARCDRCGWNWPESKLNYRDGKLICPNHSTYLESTNMKTVRLERAGARLARLREPIPKYPHPPEMRGVSGVERIFTDVNPPTQPTDNPPIALKNDGVYSVPLRVTGRDLSVLDVLVVPPQVALKAPTVIETPLDIDTRKVTIRFTVYAPIGATPGDYDLIYNGDTFKGIFRVRQ